jgi:hypothetical protein
MCEVPDAKPADSPSRRDGRERLEDEAALCQLRVRDRQLSRIEPTAAPQRDVEIEDTWTPTAPAAAAERLLKCFEAGEHGRRLEIAFNEGNGIGKVTAGSAVRRIENDRGSVEQAEFLVQPGNRRLDDLLRPAEAPVRSIRANCDRIEVGHPAGPVIASGAKQSSRRTGLLRHCVPRNDS